MINRYSSFTMLSLLAGLFLSGGCGLGLGYIDIEEVEPEGMISFRIENGTTGDAEVTILVTVPQTDSATEESEWSDSGNGGGEFDQSASQVITTSPDVIVRLPGGGITTGELSCGQMITISAVSGDASSTTVQFSGAGTGTPGFDSGSVGPTGERFLITDTDYVCGDTILIRIEAADLGNLEVVAEGTPLPDPITPPDEDGDDPDGDGDDGDDTPPDSTSVVMFRLENATATPADITITSTSTITITSDDSDSAGGEDGDQEDGQEAEEEGLAEEETSTTTSVRTPAGEFTTGQIACGDIFTVRAVMGDVDVSSVLFTGDGTGTAGFDSASIGFDGERLLIFSDHYACGETIVIRIADDGSGIGQSTSTIPLGTVNVFSSGTPLPDPDLPDPDQPDEEEEDEQEITVQIVNETGSTIQINFASGNGTLASSGGVDVSDEFDVRVLPGTTSVGTTTCAQEFVVAAAHIEATSSTLSDEESGGTIFTGGGGANYHGVVLTGDGTGTEGFDEESIAVTRGRLFQLEEHFSCGCTITVTVIATNNQFEYDEEGELVLDEYGNPTIKYNIGTGTVTVEGF